MDKGKSPQAKIRARDQQAGPSYNPAKPQLGFDLEFDDPDHVGTTATLGMTGGDYD